MPTSSAPGALVLLAVDQQVGEGAALWVAPVRANPVGRSKSGSMRTWRSSARGAGPSALSVHAVGARVHRDAYRTTLRPSFARMVPDQNVARRGRVGSAVRRGGRCGGQGVRPANHGKSSPRTSLSSQQPLDIPLPSGFRLRPMSIRQRCQGVPHHPPDCFAILMPKAKLIFESICERTQWMPHHHLPPGDRSDETP
jgi:hypothetical protein